MCGVFGYAAKGRMTPAQQHLAHDLMAELALVSEVRGRDAGGFAALCANGDLVCRRQPGSAGLLFRGPQWRSLRRRRVLMAIGHARLATHGAPAVNGNNHPHLAGSIAERCAWPLWAVVHNGFIPWHERKAAALGVRLKSQCDSDLLVEVLNRYGEAEGPEACLTLGGKQSVLAINAASRTLLAWTNGEMPLVAFRVEDLPGTWWASTREIAICAAAQVGRLVQFYSVKPQTVYRLRAEGSEL